MTDLVIGADGLARCAWGASTPDYVVYHDNEWGRPVRGDDALYERITLEAFQSGLSWLTILRKREAFRAAFDGFEIERVAGYGEADVARLLADAGDRPQPGQDRGGDRQRPGRRWSCPDGLAALLWSFAPPPRRRGPGPFAEVPATTPGVDRDGQGRSRSAASASSARPRRTR